MLKTVGELLETRVEADDGARGQVVDAYFDEETWTIEYLLIELPGDVSPTRHVYPVRQFDERGGGGPLRLQRLAPPLYPIDVLSGLRSSREVLGCDVAGWTGALGTAEEVLIEMDSWLLLFLVVDAGSWCPGATVLVQPHLVESAKWEKREIEVAVTRVEVVSAPTAGDVQNALSGEPRRLH